MTTRVYSAGTAAVASDKRTVTLTGGAWTSLNCTASSLIVINGYWNFVNALTDTTHLTLQIDYGGTVPASGLQYAIYPLTANEVSTATANLRLATLLAALAVSPAGIPLIMDGSGITDVDPGSGKVRFNSASAPTIAYINKVDTLGVSIATFLAAIGTVVNASSRGTLQFIPNDGSNAYLSFGVTGAITDAGTYVKVPVTLLAGTVPANLAALAMASVPAGADGVNGLAPGIPLLFDTTTTDFDPGGPGKIRANSATFGSIAFLYVDNVDTGSISTAVSIALLSAASNAVARSIINFTTASGAEVMSFKVTGAVIDGGSGTYWKIPVTGISGALPSNGTAMRMGFAVSGADGAGSVTSVNAQTGAVLLKSSEQIENLGLAFSVGSSALTCAAKQADGSTDASASAPVYVGMRSATLTSGAFAQRSIVAALSLVVPSTATLGHTSAVAGNLYWYLLDNAGTLELAVSATDFGRAGIASTTTIAGGSNTAATMYSTTGRSNVPFRKIALTIDTQTVAGTWAAAPSTVQVSPTADDTKLAKANNLSDLAGPLATAQKNLGVREVLTGARTYYVRTDGSDSNTGLVNSAGGGFLTIQKAINVAAALDFNSNTVTVQIADGTYTAGAFVPPMVGQVATAGLTIQGNSGTPANVIISTTNADCFATATGARALIKDMELRTTTAGYCLDANGVGVELQWTNVRFGACAGDHILASGGALVTCIGNYAITGAAGRHWNSDRGIVEVGNRTITITGTPAFSAAFANASQGHIRAFNNTYSGSATGVRYNVAMNGTIQTFGAGASALPGNSAGTTATGGQYA
jgi:hypothetical protein